MLIQGGCGVKESWYLSGGADTVVICQAVSVWRSPCLPCLVCSLSDIDHIRKQTPEQAQPGGVGVGHAGTSQHLCKQHKVDGLNGSKVLRSLKLGGKNHNTVTTCLMSWWPELQSFTLCMCRYMYVYMCVFVFLGFFFYWSSIWGRIYAPYFYWKVFVLLSSLQMVFTWCCWWDC